MKKTMAKILGGFVVVAELVLVTIQIRRLVYSLRGIHKFAKTKMGDRPPALKNFIGNMNLSRKRKTQAVYLLSCLLFTNVSEGQAPATEKRNWPLVFSVFNVGTQLPGGGALGIFSTPVHPGASLGTEYQYNKGIKNRWFQTARLGLLYHRFSQTAVQLYTEAGYRRQIWRGTAAELRAGGGYLHSFPGLEHFKLEGGSYVEKKNFGRAQAMVGGTFGLSYAFPKAAASRVFLDYQFYLQVPFIKSYVPLLPNVALHVGAALKIGN